MPTAAKHFYPTDRPSAKQRGYDAKWTACRKAFIRQHRFCQWCAKQGKQKIACIVDHKIPFRGSADPLRLAWSNLQALCRSCHAKKTNEDKAAGCGRRWGR
jgi:5-methylcytosine-specific restriction enzyme A